MKIRAGFVSNSSSTSYVIAVTRNFKTDQAGMQKFLDACISEWDDNEITDLEQADKKIGEIVEALCSHEQIWNTEAPVSHISEFVDTFKDDIVLFAIDGGPEDGKVLNAMADSCKEKTIAKIAKLLMESQNEN
jgi:hypothetical protein